MLHNVDMTTTKSENDPSAEDDGSSDGDNIGLRDEELGGGGPGSASTGTDEDSKLRKRRERLEQNRISARESRKRKKTMIEELQRTVITLSRENKELNERNESLRRKLMEIGTKVR
uniref:BZIP domain-containing protein n=1 Tax=Ditylum brightwellii TaxID=49249 RepID=A0A7S4SVS1_9STRA|mmetsp:Transcript_7536/g.10403  ORF Transcript_7536/g.10403 Transcript_7536/m.10403 type:complete len:116 (+) Transcript_7536:206-553(+)